MGILENGLEKVAVFQKKFTILILISMLFFTIFTGIGISKVKLQTDINEEMPQDFPIYQINDQVRDKFGGQDTIILVFNLDDSSDFKSSPKDIRDPEIINYLISLENELKKEGVVDNVFSGISFLDKDHFQDIEEIRVSLKNNPFAQQYFSKDYLTTIMVISTDVGSGEAKLLALSDLINEKLNGLSIPGGVKVMMTGNPSMRVTIFGILASDALYTLILASLTILLLLFVMERSITKGLLVFIPLLLGLIWTMGTMGWLGIDLSIATVGLGAMILGLAVEYSVFMLTRYKEERELGQNQLDSLKMTVSSIGSAVLGSGFTTIVGFMALTLSVFPMMQHLGMSLALGIFFCLTAAVFVFPAIVLFEENLEYWNTNRKNKGKLNKKAMHKRLN